MLYLTCQFDFSAAHCLHVPSLSDDENRREFGKCVGLHGHNYVLEVTVSGPAAPLSGEVYPLPRLREKVKQLVVDRFDHTCLNSDVDEFASLNPTVENLTTVVWDLLEGQFEPAELQRVRVYETPKIWADRSRGLALDERRAG
jgi:6-pyruvoyltetrahydropterin/6-carboxytetrahydropterin synthase